MSQKNSTTIKKEKIREQNESEKRPTFRIDKNYKKNKNWSFIQERENILLTIKQNEYIRNQLINIIIHSENRDTSSEELQIKANEEKIHFAKENLRLADKEIYQYFLTRTIEVIKKDLRSIKIDI